MTNQQAKRRIKLIQPRFQLRLAGSFAALCALALMVEVLVLALELTSVTKGLPAGGAYLAEQIPTILIRSVLISAGLILPALVVIGIRMTFRIAGPLYRFEQHLQRIVAGEWPSHCKIRENDELQDFCALLNKALDSAHTQGTAQAQQGAVHEEKHAA